MKTKVKVLYLAMMILVGFSISAQPRIAVLNFNAGVNVSQSDVDGLSAIFNTYLEPAGYIVVERTRVSRIIEEQNMQIGRLTEKEMVKLSEILNVSVIVIGDVNKAMGQYNTDVRAVNVETGEIIAKDGAEWAEGTSYRSMMRALAERFSKSIPLVEIKRPEPKPEPKPKEKQLNPTYRHTGGYLRIHVGSPAIGGLAYNHQITPYFMLGGGAGFAGADVYSKTWDWEERHYHNYYNPDNFFDRPTMQIYAETELRTPQYNGSLFLNLQVGATIKTLYHGEISGPAAPIFIAIHGGISFQNLHLGVGWSSSAKECPSLFLAYNLPLKLLF